MAPHEHQRCDMERVPMSDANRVDWLSFADHNMRLNPRGIHDFTDRRRDAGLDTQPLLFLDCRLDTAPLDEILRCQRRPTPRPPRRSWRRGARRSEARCALRGCRRSQRGRCAGPVIPPRRAKAAPDQAPRGKREGCSRLDPHGAFAFVPCDSAATGKPHADRNQDARFVADDGGGDAGQMAGQGRRHGHVGDLLAEIETDKATMEFEAVDEGTIRQDTWSPKERTALRSARPSR